jgi:hypothetical protein
MDLKTRIGIKLYKFFRYFSKPQKRDAVYRISNIFCWDMKDWSSDPIDLTDVFLNGAKSQGCNNQKIVVDSIALLLESQKIKTSDNYFIEIIYEFRGIQYRILYDKKIVFPPFQSEDQTPESRFQNRDFYSFEWFLDDDYDSETASFDEGPEVDFNSIIFELRGPGKGLFYSEVDSSVKWDMQMLWLKRYFLQKTKMPIREDELVLEFLWSNGDKETF